MREDTKIVFSRIVFCYCRELDGEHSLCDMFIACYSIDNYVGELFIDSLYLENDIYQLCELIKNKLL
jgi:hypothetical protein